MRQRLDEGEEEGVVGRRTHASLQTQLSDAEAALERERLKVKRLEGELVTHSVVKEGMDKDAEKVSCSDNVNVNNIACMVISTTGTRILSEIIKSPQAGLCNCSSADGRLCS